MREKITIYTVTVHLKSGAQFSFPTVELTVKRNTNAELVSLEWKAPEGGTRRLSYIRLDDVSAIVVDEK